MAFEIKLPANPAHYSLEPPPAPPLGGFSTSGPGAAVERQVEETLQRIAAVGQAVALGSEAFRRVGGALDPQGAAAWPPPGWRRACCSRC